LAGNQLSKRVSTIANSPINFLRPTRQALILLWVLALLAALALAPSAFAATQADWQFNEAVRTMSSVSYETLTAVVAGIRLGLAGLFLLTAGVLLALPARAGSLLAALALMTLPFIFGLTGAAKSFYPNPWAALLDGLALVMGLVGLAALILLLFLFPDGRFYPAWLRVPALIGWVAIVAGIVALEFVEEAWVLFMLALLIVMALGLVGQVWRYRAADLIRRRQTAGFLIAVVALPVWILTSAGGASPLLTLIANFVILALIPVGLLIAVGRGLWGQPDSARLFAVTTTTLIVAVVLAAAAAAGLWWRANQPPAIDVAALTASGSIPVIVDTDMAMDDIAALLYLLRHPAIDLKAITVNGVAFAHCDAGVRNSLGLLEMAGAPEIPVSCGQEQPFPGGRPAPDDWRKSADNLYGARVMTRGRAADDRTAGDLLADTIRAAPGEIVIVAIGPLTNLAAAFQADPSLVGQIREIVIMGGALDAPGNVADGDNANEVAEWNFFADPVAADIVLASGAPITLVPLDATNDVPFSPGFYQRLWANHLTRPAVFIYNLLYLNPWWLDGGMYWWDTLAAAAATDPALVTVEAMALDVVTDEGPEMGRAIESAGGSPVRVAVAADRQRFEALFLAVLNHE
jgi:pyrimidine-specific ribonucleoside hydrolase